MEKTFKIILTLLFIVILASCSDGAESKFGTLYLTVDALEKVSKTVEPINTEAYKMEITSFDYLLKLPDDTYLKATDATDTVELKDLILGTYTVYAYGKNSDGVIIAEGEKTFKLTSGVNNIIVELTEVSGYGSFIFDITWDSKLAGANVTYTATVTPISHTGESFDATEDYYLPDTGYLSIRGANIKSGSYIITVKLYNEESVFIGGIVEAIRIAASAESSYEKYIRIDLGSSMESMTIKTEDMVGIPIIGTISEELGELNSEGIPSTVTLSYSLTSWNGEMDAAAAGVTVSWYVDTVLVGTGNNVEFTPTLSKSRIDAVFYQEAYKGSIGSISKTLDYGISASGTGFSVYTP